MHPSRIYSKIPVLVKFLKKLFSTQNKRLIRKFAIKINQQEYKQSYKNYFICTNLIINSKLLLIWEQETFKLLHHLRFASGSSQIRPFDQITNVTRSNGLFRQIGYGELLDNLDFLEEIAKKCKNGSYIPKVVETLSNNLDEIDKLNSICSPLQTLVLNRPISPNSLKKLSIEGAVLFRVIEFGHFDKSLLFPMQQVAISIFNQTKTDENFKALHLYTELVFQIKDLPDVKEFIRRFLSSASKVKFVSDIFFPEIDGHFYDMKVPDLEKCRHCEWRYVD